MNLIRGNHASTSHAPKLAMGGARRTELYLREWHWLTKRHRMHGARGDCPAKLTRIARSLVLYAAKLEHVILCARVRLQCRWGHVVFMHVVFGAWWNQLWAANSFVG